MELTSPFRGDEMWLLIAFLQHTFHCQQRATTSSVVLSVSRLETVQGRDDAAVEPTVRKAKNAGPIPLVGRRLFLFHSPDPRFSCTCLTYVAHFAHMGILHTWAVPKKVLLRAFSLA